MVAGWELSGDLKALRGKPFESNVSSDNAPLSQRHSARRQHAGASFFGTTHTQRA
jgi:hypothetical protein